MHRTSRRSNSPFAAFTAVLAVGVLLLGAPLASVAMTALPVVARDLGFHPDLTRAGLHPLATPTCTTTSLCTSAVLNAYGFGPLLANATMNGTGQSVVIVDACGDSNIVTDLSTFNTKMGLPPANLTIYQPQGAPCSDPTGWGLETALDVEWAHAMAPGAHLQLVEAATASNKNLYGAWNYSLAHKLGNVISNSWGGGGGCPANAKNLLAKATRAHVSILASSGDSARWGSGTRATAQQPADCQAVVTIGGTSLHLVNGSGGYSSESAWSGSGGGYTAGTTEPSYQTTANITDSFVELGKPDVSAVADPSTGVWVFDKSSGGWLVVGGTSVACPIWAGYVADVNSWRAANSFAALGSVNSFLYLTIYGANGSASNYALTMHDVTTGSNGWSAGTGWDAATGLGSFRAYALANVLANNAAA